MRHDAHSSATIVDALKKAGAGNNLLAANIVTDEQIWARLGHNRNGELNALSTTLGLPPSVVLDVITASSLAAAARFDPHWLKRHAPDYLAILVIAGVLVLLVGLVGRGLPALGQLVMTRDLQPFEPIRDSDVAFQAGGRMPGAFSNPADLSGRYSITGIAKGRIPISADLSAGRLSVSLSGRSIVRLPFKLGKAALPWTLPVSVTLLIAPRHTGPSPLVVDDTWILGLQGSGDIQVAWVAVPSARLPQIAGSLGDAEILLSRP